MDDPVKTVIISGLKLKVKDLTITDNLIWSRNTGRVASGDMAGFFGDYKDGRKWLITEVSIKDQTASLSIINDYGSEDLTAELSVTPEGKYIFKQLKGSTMKIARNRKWLKLPKTIEFIRR